jgi:hypothetical protein
VVGRIKICKEDRCKNAATTRGFCRLHYLHHWKDLKSQERQKATKRLNSYIEGICRDNPKGHMDQIKDDLSGEGTNSNPRNLDDNYASGEVEGILEDLGYNDDNKVDRLISRIKIDDSF